MKKCPTCNRTYADNSLTYCLADGSLLSAPYDPEATQRIPIQPITDLPPTEVLNPNPPRSELVRRSNNPALIYIIVAVLALMVGGGAVALLNSRDVFQFTPKLRPPMNVDIDTIVCTGIDCNDAEVMNGERLGAWQVVRWETSIAETLSRGPQLKLPEDKIQQIFCKSSYELTAEELRSAVRGTDYRIKDNREAASFFDLKTPASTHFSWADNGRINFIGSGQGNHHIRLIITIILNRVNCRP